MLNPTPWVVHKFGGSSVADADCFRKVAAILDSAPAARLGVVLAACGGVTDALLRVVALAERHDDTYRGELAQLRTRHAGIAGELLTPTAAQAYLGVFDRDCHDLLGVLHSVKLTRAAAHNVRDLIAGYGEIWSTRLFQRFFQERAHRRPGAVEWLDARWVVVAQWGPLGPGIQWAESRANLQAMAPAVKDGIPIWIRNTFAPDRPGTLICARPSSALPVKGITSIDRVALINLEGAGMIGVPGTAHRLFGALREEGISVILISQGSSEHSICCAIPQDQAQRAAGVVRRAFERELQEGQIQSVDVDPDLATLAVVGDAMAGTPGVAAKVFAALGTSGVNVRAIAQGASERNISVVVEGRSATRALRAVHAGLYLSPHTLSIGVIGPGTVGRVLLDQLASQSERLRRQCQLDLRVRGVLGSQRMLLADPGLALGEWRTRYRDHGTAGELTRFVEHVRVDYLPHTVLIDCTASAAIAGRYAEWLAAGIHIVTPNKKANSADLAYYHRLHEARRAGASHYLYEATVGAGLPVVHTLRDLRETGDEISSIEGIFSGTLAYLFNVYDGRVAFSEIVQEARQRGFTEPDPRDDLSGEDVARKLIILGREMGL